MAFVIKDRVKEGTTTTGTGDMTLGGAAATFDAFTDHMSDGDTTHYAIVHTASGTDEWEVGIGTWNTGNTLTRTTVLAGSSGTSKVNFSSGNKDIFMTQPAAATALLDTDSNDLVSTVTLGNHDTDDLAEGSTNLYYTDTRAQDAITVTDSGGDGSLTKSGGTITYTGPSATETRAHFTGGTGVTITDGSVAIGQAVGTSDNVTFNNITSTGTVTLSADPTASLGAATKQYVDTIASAGIHYHDPVRVESPSALTVTYDNGSSGVGATLTNAGTQEAITIDGVALSLNDRVLIYKQTDQTQNGVYTVTTVGDGSTNWVLTRATDADSYGASDPDSFGKGDAFFVKEGNTGAGELYVMNTSGTITFGTTNIVFTQVAETAVYSAGNSLTLTGTTFDTVQDIRTTASPTFAGVTAPLTGNVTGDVTGDVTGNADTATTLETARTIAGQSFDGSANISIAPTDLTGVTATAAEINVLDGITATTAELNYTDGVTSNIQTQINAKADGATTISAGSGLTGGGSLAGNRTISHSDTSTQASVNNSNGTVIQDVTLDTYGHVTGLTSYNLDGRYYTETEADSRFVNVTGDTMTGALRHDQDSLTASGGTLTINLANANNFYVTMTANTTIAFSNIAAGRYGNIIFKQDATGGRSFTLPSSCKTPVNGASITQSTGANEISVLSYYVADSSTILVNYIGDFA